MVGEKVLSISQYICQLVVMVRSLLFSVLFYLFLINSEAC